MHLGLDPAGAAVVELLGHRRRWQYDKRVRSTHGVNCTGSCSWDVYVENGIIVWETAAGAAGTAGISNGNSS